MDLNLFFSPEHVGQTVCYIIGALITLVLSCNLVRDDLVKKSMVMWKIALVALVMFITTIIGRAVSGTFQWYDILPIPIFIVLNLLNTAVNKGRFLGQGDVDILCISIALYVPAIIRIMSIDTGYDLVNQIYLLDLIGYGAIFFIIGLILSLIVIGIRLLVRFINRKKHPEVKVFNIKEKMPVVITFVPLLFYAMYIGIFI